MSRNLNLGFGSNQYFGRNLNRNLNFPIASLDWVWNFVEGPSNNNLQQISFFKGLYTLNIFAHNIEIKRHFDKNIFFLQNIVVTFKNIFKLGFNKYNCPKINIFNTRRKKYWMKKIIFINLFITMSFYRNIVCENV